MTATATFVIGDVHGHVDRLRALLEQEDIIDARGLRQDRDVNVVQLGDLGHYGRTGDRDGDLQCWRRAKQWIDIVLWGNHDRATYDPGHRFSGYAEPDDKTRFAMADFIGAGRVRFAVATHGWLLTHAGVHPAFEDQIPDEAREAARWLNDAAGLPAVNAISPHRGGGPHMVGGILWRDYQEPLSTRWPQVYGHTRADAIRCDDDSWCIDVGDQDNGRLAGIWLPTGRTAEVIAGAYEFDVSGSGGTS